MLRNYSLLPISNTEYSNARFVVFGVPDDSGSAYRKGSSMAPNAIRRFVGKNEVGAVIIGKRSSLFEPEMSIFDAKVLDMGNFSLGRLEALSNMISNDKKIPVMIGGDHSITYKLLSRIAPKRGKWSILYFDAHPDIVSSRGSYFGSVINDISKIRGFDPKRSVIVGVRTPEREEVENIGRMGINTITPLEIERYGINRISANLDRILGEQCYISIDMDVLDPSFAPGVTEPEPAGITPTQLIYLAKRVAERKRVIGFDVMEVCPKFDINNMTLHLSYRILLEIIDSVSRYHI